MKLKNWMIRKALEEFSGIEFTQYELHDKLERYLGRPLTPGEKRKATMYVEKYAYKKEVKIHPTTRIKIYIFML